MASNIFQPIHQTIHLITRKLIGDIDFRQPESATPWPTMTSADPNLADADAALSLLWNSRKSGCSPKRSKARRGCPKTAFRISTGNTQASKHVEVLIGIQDIFQQWSSKSQMLDDDLQEVQLNHLYIVEFQGKIQELDQKNLISNAMFHILRPIKNDNAEPSTKESLVHPTRYIPAAKAIELESNVFIQCLSFNHLVISWPGNSLDKY